jgi:thiol-disulfide isomerase/thioredoxin
MKVWPLLFLAAVAAAAPLLAQENSSSDPTPDQAWAELDRWILPPRAPTGAEGRQAIARWLDRQRISAERFAEAYPNDRRRWDAKLIALAARDQLRVLGIAPGKPEDDQKELEQIVAAPDVSVDVQGEAIYRMLRPRVQRLNQAVPEEIAAAAQALADFLEVYPQHRRVPEIAGVVFQILQSTDLPNERALVETLAAHPQPGISDAAKELLGRVQQQEALRSQPVDLRFTALKGDIIDFQKLRGKVVLLDFWASWCAPCIAEMPSLVETYGKLREKGFEIIGISLDEEKADLEQAIKKHGVTWPQSFEGKAWDNRYAQKFGVAAIPSTWLIDKNGMIRQIGLRGEELTAAIEKLLAE